MNWGMILNILFIIAVFWSLCGRRILDDLSEERHVRISKTGENILKDKVKSKEIVHTIIENANKLAEGETVLTPSGIQITLTTSIKS